MDVFDFINNYYVDDGFLESYSTSKKQVDFLFVVPISRVHDEYSWFGNLFKSLRGKIYKKSDYRNVFLRFFGVYDFKVFNLNLSAKKNCLPEQMMVDEFIVLGKVGVRIIADDLKIEFKFERSECIESSV